MARKPHPLPALPRPAVGVYLSAQRETAIVVDQTINGVWYLTWSESRVDAAHMSDERFYRAYPKYLPDYPIRRALRKYGDGTFKCSEQAEKVIKYLLERL